MKFVQLEGAHPLEKSKWEGNYLFPRELFKVRALLGTPRGPGWLARSQDGPVVGEGPAELSLAVGWDTPAAPVAHPTRRSLPGGLDGAGLPAWTLLAYAGPSRAAHWSLPLVGGGRPAVS